MFIVQQKKRRNQSNREGQQTRRRKKKGRRRSNQRCQCGGNLLHWCLFKSCISSIFPFSFCTDRNVRYTPIRPVLSGMGRYLEQYILKVFRYWFIDRYEEFWPYRPVWYSINILASKGKLMMSIGKEGAIQAARKFKSKNASFIGVLQPYNIRFNYMVNPYT